MRIPLGLRAASRKELNVSFVQTYTNSSDLTTYTFSGANLGTANSTREVFVIVSGLTPTSRTISSATISGVSATITTVTTGGLNFAGVIFASVPSGSTGDISVTLSGGASNMAIAVYSVTNRISSGAGQTDSAAAGGVNASSPVSTSALTINGKGFGLGVYSTTNNRTYSSNVFTINEYTTALSGEGVYFVFMVYVNPSTSATTPTQSITFTSTSTFRYGYWAFDN